MGVLVWFLLAKGGFLGVMGCLGGGAVLGIIHFLVQWGALADVCLSQIPPSSLEEFSERLLMPGCSGAAWAIGGLPVSIVSAAVQVAF